MSCIYSALMSHGVVELKFTISPDLLVAAIREVS